PPPRLTPHRVLDRADPRSADRAGNAAAHRLSEHRTNVETACASGQHRQQGGEKLAAARAAERAGDGVAERAEVEVLERGAGGITAGRAEDELDDEIDDRG